MNLGTVKVSQYLLVGVLRPLSAEEGHSHEVVIPGQESAWGGSRGHGDGCGMSHITILLQACWMQTTQQRELSNLM